MQGTPNKRNWAVIILLGIGLALTTLSLVVTARKADEASMGGLL